MENEEAVDIALVKINPLFLYEIKGFNFFFYYPAFFKRFLTVFLSNRSSGYKTVGLGFFFYYTKYVYTYICVSKERFENSKLWSSSCSMAEIHSESLTFPVEKRPPLGELIFDSFGYLSNQDSNPGHSEDSKHWLPFCHCSRSILLVWGGLLAISQTY